MSSTNTLRAINDMVVGLKADGVWTKLTEVYLLSCVTSLSGVLIKLKGTGSLTNVNFVSGDYVAAGSGAGLVGNGSTKYLNAGTAVSGGLSAYCTVAPSATGDYIAVDAFPSSNRVRLFYDSAVPSVSANIGGDNSARVNDGTTLTGMFTTSRQLSTSLKIFRNGASVATSATSTTFTAPSVLPLYLFAVATSGSPGAFFNGRQSICVQHNHDLTDTDAANLSTRVNALMTAIGANVY